MSWSVAGCERVLGFLARETGLEFPPGRGRDAETGIRGAMSRAGLSDVGEFARLLEEGRASLDDLLAELTVGETYFFRDPNQFEFVRKLLPEVRARRMPDHTLRVWSAGCASGEEAYTLAILLEQEGLAGHSRVIGTDICRAALEKAGRAEYGAWAFRATAPEFRSAYFRRRGNLHRLEDRIRTRVRFEYLNLALDAYPSFTTGIWAMDLILCRNVLIYLNDRAVRHVANRLWETLAVGGWLITGPSDPLLTEIIPCEALVTTGGIYYQKVEKGIPSVRIPEALLPEAGPAKTFPEPAAGRPEETSPSRTGSDLPEERPPDRIVPEARRALQSGEYLRAAALLKDEPRSAEGAALYIRALANSRGSAVAAEAAAGLLARYPTSAELHYLQATLLLDLGRDEEAVRVLRKVLYLEPGLAVAHLLLGAILRRRGDSRSAARAYRNVLSSCALLPPGAAAPLSDGEPAVRLAEVARQELRLLEVSR